MSFTITGALYRFLRTVLEAGGKCLALIFRRNEKALDFLRFVNRRINASLARSTLSPSADARSRGEVHGDFGVNVAGYITSESGMGEAARANIRSLQQAGIPFVLNNLSSFARQKDSTYTTFIRKNPYAINLIHVTADQAPAFYREQGERYFRSKYNVGVWYWELQRFPHEWQDRYAFFHEIWAATEFCRMAIAASSPIPVVKIPPSLVIDPMPVADRKRFGIPEGDFVFCCLFSFLSVFERKNPLAAIEAFRRAFAPDERALLVLKSSHGDLNPRAKTAMAEAAKGLRVLFLEHDLRKQDLYALLSSIDCLVSLHRSEGFGLPLAEAMHLGKPVIATAYSGNTDFMTIENSFPVPYKLVEIDRDYGPYRKGNVWAEPDVGRAAALMRRVYEEREAAQRIGDRARHDIIAQFGPSVTGRVIAERLRGIADAGGLSLPVSPSKK